MDEGRRSHGLVEVVRVVGEGKGCQLWMSWKAEVKGKELMRLWNGGRVRESLLHTHVGEVVGGQERLPRRRRKLGGRRGVRVSRLRRREVGPRLARMRRLVGGGGPASALIQTRGRRGGVVVVGGAVVIGAGVGGRLGGVWVWRGRRRRREIVWIGRGGDVRWEAGG